MTDIEAKLNAIRDVDSSGFTDDEQEYLDRVNDWVASLLQ